jgi:hypothetical protein
VKRVLNVGGSSKAIPIPAHYAGWEHVLLDIDPGQEPDIVCDARELGELAAGEFDAVYCSHNLEHYWRHDLPRVLSGFVHVLADDGFTEIRVPDLMAVFAAVRERGLDLEDILYESPAGPISVNDVIYGFGREIEQSGDDFFAHKNAFTVKSLTRVLVDAGFAAVYCGSGPFEIHAFAFKRSPSEEQRALFGRAG